jgi:TPR repeat protein
MEVFSSQPYAFSPQDISLLQHLTGIIVSAMDRGATVSAPAPTMPRAPLPGTQRPTIQPPRNQEISATDVMAGTMAAVGASPRPRFHKILLAAAAVTFLFALLWSLAPWLSGRISRARSNQARTSSPVNERQTTAPKPSAAPQPGDVSDLAGLRKLAEQGDPAAQFALGARYATGEEVAQDYSEAVRWFAMAADRGHILAQATWGAYYWAGRGVPPDLTKAYFWSALAQAGGDQASKYRVAVLTSRMSRGEILTAQQQANDWLRNHPTAGNARPSR